MRVFAHAILTALTALSVAGCENPFVITNRVDVRFRNATSLSLTDISLTWPGGSMQVSQLDPGGVSNFELHDGAYPYGSLRVTANGAVRQLQPIDYTGASPLGPGRYTYVIVRSTYVPDGIDLQLEADR
jgi:hypothetical protein